MSVWNWLKFVTFLWLLRKGFKLARWLLVAVAAVAAWPVTAVAGAGYAAAWLRGWPPVRLYRAAAWTLIVMAAWLAALEVSDPGFLATRQPGRAWGMGWDQLTVAGLARTFALLAPVAVPAGLALAGLIWAWRIYAITTGLGGIRASAPIAFDRRQWRRQIRTAKGLAAAPGAVPLLARGGHIPIGGTIRAIGHRWHPVLTLPAAACTRHMVIVGSTGSGKTNLMIRLWAGWFTATTAAAQSGRGDRPLLVVLDCKGGRDARRKADRTRRLLYGAGARRVAVWPDEARLCLWDIPPNDLAVLLYQMIDSGTGAAAYYADVLQAVITLAVTAPCGPPLSTQAFLDRLNATWLASAWNDGRHLAEAEHARAAARHLPDIQLRYATLLRRLGPALDGPGGLAEADAWYCILEGTREQSVAEAQAMALTELAAYTATSLDGHPRAMLLAADDYSAVSGRVPLSNLYERGRSLGIGVQVSAQSWEGLGATEDERYRIAATADGGVFVLNTPHPEPLAALAGKRRVLETAHRIIGGAWGDEGTTREQRAWAADPDLVRRLDVGQACYIHRGAATFVQVARPRPSPLSLLPPPPVAPPVAPVPGPRCEPASAPDPWPSLASLDDIFGPESPR
jgi:Helicase HerA, central domain